MAARAPGVGVRPLRICLLSPYSWPEVTRGGERYLHDLAWYLAGRSHKVEVLSGTDRGPYREEFEGASYTRLHHRLPPAWEARGTTKFDTFGAVALPWLIRHRFDVVHSLSATGAVAARLAGQKTIYTPLGLPTEDQFGRRPLDRRMFAAGVRAAHLITALSRASARQVQLMLGRSAEPLSPGLRAERFPVELGPRTGPPRILFPAFAADRRKGVNHLLQAAPMVLDRHPEARFQLMGGGDHTWALDTLGPHRERVERAVDARHASDIGPLYRQATVVVLPSQYEAFGLVLVEALSSGTPVVCSDDGGMSDIVTSPGIGKMTGFGNVAGLARALLEVIQLAGRPETPGRCAEHAMQWDWAKTSGPAHELLYRRAADM